MPNSYSSWRTGVQIDNFYPVGSIYFSVNATNPHDLFGGTWEALGGKFLIGADANYIAGSEGGSASSSHTHTMEHTHSTDATTTGGTSLSIANMPAHNHGQATLTGQGRWRDFAMGDHNGLLSASGICSVGRSVTWSGNHDKFAVAGNQSSNLYNDLNINASHTHTTQGSGTAHTHSQVATTSNGASNSTTSEASNTDNLPPYLVVYIWKRIA